MVVGFDEFCCKQQQDGSDTEDIAGQVRIVCDGVGGEFCFDDVIPDNHFEDDEIQGREVNCTDEEEPIENGDDGSRKEHEICSCYSGDGPTGTEDGIYVQKGVSDAGEDSSGQVEACVADVAELIVYVVAEEVEKVHVAEDVH